MTADATPPGAVWRPRYNPWLIAATVTLATFMEVLDTTIVNVALGHIAGSLASSNDEATWVLTSYLVSNGIVLTISAWLGDILGRKRYFVICIVMFTVCSLLCGTSTSLAELIVFRLLQGFFGGGMQPNQQSIILDIFPPERRGAAFGLAGVATVVAPALGPSLGGWITDNWSWRWIFFINVPIGMLAAFLASVLVEDPPWLQRRKSRGIDYVGLVLITVGLGSLQVMMDRGEDEDWFGSQFIRVMAGFAFVGIAGAIGWLLIARKPIVNLAVFTDRNFAVGCMLIAASSGILYSSAVSIPQFSQMVLMYTATWAGLVLSPGGVVLIALIPVVGMLARVIEIRYVIAFGFVTLALSLWSTSGITIDIDFRTLVVMRTLQSMSLGFLLVPINTVTFRTLPRRLNSDGAALFAMLRNVSGSIGISLATAAITERTQVHQAYLARWVEPFNQPFQALIASYEQALRAMGRAGAAAHDAAIGRVYQVYLLQAAVLAYADIFMYLAAVAAVMVPLCLLVSSQRRARRDAEVPPPRA